MRPSVGLLFPLGLSLCLNVNAGPIERRNPIWLENGNEAVALNAKFKTLSPFSPCDTTEPACVNDSIANCSEGMYKLTGCPTGLVCRASPRLGYNENGTYVMCMTVYENTMRIRATGLAYSSPEEEDPSQSSLTLDSAVLSTQFKENGQDNITDVGQVPSQTSSNNWINFCKIWNKPLTNGSQVRGGSCNNAPIGLIPSVDNMPSAKFIFPTNFGTIPKNQSFTVQVAVSHLETGWFTNAMKTYMSSPQVVNAVGDVIGHSHIVIEQLPGGFNQTTPTDPKNVIYFQGLNAPAVDGVLSWEVPSISVPPPGYYRIAVVHSAANHQPIAVPVAKRGALGDMVYFSVV